MWIKFKALLYINLGFPRIKGQPDRRPQEHLLMTCEISFYIFLNVEDNKHGYCSN